MAASSCHRVMQRASSSLKSAVKSNARSSFLNNRSTTSTFTLPSRSSSPPLRRFSLSRPVAELGCVQSLLPLHSAVAAARLTSCLSTTSRSCRALSQGILCCTSPGL